MLLIGEYRRHKNKEKVLFLCPTNQLVHQVIRQSNLKYGLKQRKGSVESED